MPRLTPCPSCHAHIVPQETSCPHCGAGLRQNVGKGAAVLMGLALVGCPSAEPAYGVPTTTGEPTSTDTGATETGMMETSSTETSTTAEPDYGVPDTDTDTAGEPEYGSPVID